MLLLLLVRCASADWAVVTGASSGIGEQLALQAAQRGYDVVLLEARDRVGGRVLTTEDGADLGGSWAWGEDKVKALGAATRAESGRGGLRRCCASAQPRGASASRWCGGAAPAAVAVATTGAG